MTLAKPKSEVQKVLVTFRDPDGRERSYSKTLYETTPKAALEDYLRRMGVKAMSKAGDSRAGQASAS